MRAPRDIPVADRARGWQSNAVVRLGFISNEGSTFLFNRTDRDRRRARQNVTAALLGDPPPGRTPWS